MRSDPLSRLRSALDASARLVASGEVDAGLDLVDASLRQARTRLQAPEWADACQTLCAAHPMASLLSQDPFTSHASRRPRGYPGDADLLDYIYGLAGPGRESELGRAIFDYTTNVEACRSVRSRRLYFARLLDESCAQASTPLRVLAVAAGHFREGLLSEAVQTSSVGEVIALDQDSTSLREVEQTFAGRPVRTLHASIRRLFEPGYEREVGSFDLIYASGLYDYLDDAAGSRLTRRLFDLLRPGGKLVVANFSADVPNIGYMEAFMRWQLIYREEEQMARLGAELPLEAQRSACLERDSYHNVVFLSVARS